MQMYVTVWRLNVGEKQGLADKREGRWLRGGLRRITARQTRALRYKYIIPPLQGVFNNKYD